MLLLNQRRVLSLVFGWDGDPIDIVPNGAPHAYGYHYWLRHAPSIMPDLYQSNQKVKRNREGIANTTSVTAFRFSVSEASLIHPRI
ncbi:hypothetical protein F0562_010957 [Nyssa sinensis]|uniref:Uncharacterized protein n=1 Tax=Nyssa sinensis TaxID=561372 RepID=A0A5J5A2U9_9ASTE|nr:hypothetical protein F0562_010957 [Nyssa sinensis]